MNSVLFSIFNTEPHPLVQAKSQKNQFPHKPTLLAFLQFFSLESTDSSIETSNIYLDEHLFHLRNPI